MRSLTIFAEPPATWEYKCEELDAPSHPNWLANATRLGAEGWELIQMLPSPYSDGEYTWGIFKRRRPRT